MADPSADHPMSPEEHRRLAVASFEEVWTLLDAGDHSPETHDRMTNAAHASWWHWSKVGGDEQLAIADWLCSRVHAVAGRAEPALHHARRCLGRTERADLPTWLVAEGHEAMARASAVAGDVEIAHAEAARARELCDAIPDADDRAVVEADLASLPLR